MPPLSVIIPIHPSDLSIHALLADLRALSPAAEIIVVEGIEEGAASSQHQRASEDERVRWYTAPLGRAVQLNAGAAYARNDFLWFLHADTRLPLSSIEALRSSLTTCDRKVYYLSLAFQEDGPSLTRLNAVGANLRSRLLRLPFGDQGYCLRRELFEEIGGYNPAYKYGEDCAFIARCKVSGITPTRVPGLIYTSSRKYREQGWLRTTARHLAFTARHIVWQP